MKILLLSLFLSIAAPAFAEWQYIWVCTPEGKCQMVTVYVQP